MHVDVIDRIYYLGRDRINIRQPSALYTLLTVPPKEVVEIWFLLLELGEKFECRKVYTLLRVIRTKK